MTMPHPDAYLVTAILEVVKRAREYHSCLTCTRFDHDTEVCGVAQARPPARVIVAGCPAYEEVPPF